MTDPYLGEIRMYGFNFPPQGWATCDGQLLPINQYQALYSLLGTAYGGDGQTSFALPDLRGRSPLHEGEGIILGAKGGQETVTLTTNQIPSHTHTLQAATEPASTTNPSGALLANSSSNVYGAATNLVPMSGSSVGSWGGGQAHDNMQPYLVINFCIALTGQFPPRN